MKRFACSVLSVLATLSAGCGYGSYSSTRSASCAASAALAERGRPIFDAYCAACHGADGGGGEEGIPPLAGSPWVSGPEGRPIRMVLHGLGGTIEVKSEEYSLEMPAFGLALPDADVAAVLTYVRHRFGAPSPAVTEETVKRVREECGDREEYWTASELLEIP